MKNKLISLDIVEIKKLEKDEILKFYKNIISINENLSFKFILISHDTLNIPESLIDLNFIYVNLNEHIDDEVKNEKDEYQKL